MQVAQAKEKNATGPHFRTQAINVIIIESTIASGYFPKKNRLQHMHLTTEKILFNKENPFVLGK